MEISAKIWLIVMKKLKKLKILVMFPSLNLQKFWQIDLAEARLNAPFASIASKKMPSYGLVASAMVPSI